MAKTTQTDSDALLRFVREHPRLVVLTGAGISIGSGIPSYRDTAGTWLRAEPIKHQEFLRDPRRRRRYWGRSAAGWPGVRDARPNAAHLALASLERKGVVSLVITQNVDRLHQRAGSVHVVDLHGRLDRVRCLHCAASTDREALQQQLLRENRCLAEGSAEARPDGDADLDDAVLETLRVPACGACEGVLMPEVVFFGGSVPQDRVATCSSALADADALLVVGSSLRVYSGFRFCRQAAALGKPIALVNPGVSRADDLAELRLTTAAEVLLPELDAAFASRPAAASA